MNPPPQMAPNIQRTGAVFLSLLSTLLLMVAAMQHGLVKVPRVGFEAGLVVSGLVLCAGLACTVAAALIALLQLRSPAGRTSARWLLVWCCVLLLGFAAVFMG